MNLGTVTAPRECIFIMDDGWYMARTNSDMVDIIGLAHPQASVSVDEEDGRLSRRGAYFRKEHNIGNNVYPTIEVKAVLGTNEVTETGAIFNPPAVESYSYDADGNLTADGRWSYVWEAENRLIEMVSLTNAPAASKRWLKFSYDAQSRRIGKTAESWDGSAWVMQLNNLFIYDGWNLLAELNATNNAAIRTYVWGLDLSGSMQGAGGVGGLLAVKESSKGTHFAAYDGNGNVVGLVAVNSGEVCGVYEYDPFGQTIRRSGAMAASNPVRFSSKYEDGECQESNKSIFPPIRPEALLQRGFALSVNNAANEIMRKGRMYLVLWIGITFLLSCVVEYAIYYYRTPYEKIINDTAYPHERNIYSAAVASVYSLLLLAALSRFALEAQKESRGKSPDERRSGKT